MKTKISSLLVGSLLPVLAIAQPVLTKNEFYHVGDAITMIKCDATSLGAGVSGASVSWDFSSVVNTGGIATMKVVANTSSSFATSNVVITLPDGSTEYVQENNTDSYVDAIVNSSQSETTYYNHYDISRRPIGFNTAYVDTYRMNIVTPVTNGTGVVTETGDGYGTLKLPTGTFPNVVRVYRHIKEIDSISGSPSGFYNASSYLWFDTVHSSPLFRIDTVSDVTGTTVTAMYLASPLAVKSVTTNENAYNAFIAGSELRISGDFEQGHEYNVVMYNVIGGKVLNEQVSGGVRSVRLPLGSDIAPGIYLVNMTDKQNGARAANIKVIKQ